MKERIEAGPSELICTTFVNKSKSMNSDKNERKMNEVPSRIKKRTTRRTYAEAGGK